MKLTPILIGSGLSIACSIFSMNSMNILDSSIASADSHPNVRLRANTLSYPRSSKPLIEKDQIGHKTHSPYLQQQQQLNLNQKRYQENINSLENLPSSRVDCRPISTPIPNFDLNPISCSKP